MGECAWEYDKIQDALANRGHDVSDQTVGNILKERGIKTATRHKRQRAWATFLLNAFPKPDHLRSYARQSVGLSKFVHRLATVATVLKYTLSQSIAIDSQELMPDFASRNHFGAWCLARESPSGLNSVLAWADDTLFSDTVTLTLSSVELC